MAWPRKLVPLLCLTVAVATAACQSGKGGGSQAQTPTTVAADPPTTAVATTTVGAGATTTTAAGATSTSLASGAVSLNLSARHPSGLTLKLTSIAISEDSITIGVVATNGGNKDLHLNAINVSGYDLVLLDDRGGRYTVSPPPQDPLVTVRKGTTLRGTLVFTGQLDSSATSLTLITNEKFGGKETDAFTDRPKITVAGIPVQRP
jgi:hypothetical protein